MTMCREWRSHWSPPWLEWKQFRTRLQLVHHHPESTSEKLRKRKVCRLLHYYGLEDILSEEQFKKAVQTFVHAYDCREWYLPEEIWKRIMKKVVFQDLLCWRRVCKRWNLAIMTQEWTLEANPHSQTTIPVIMRHRESSAGEVALLALKPDRKKWVRIDIGHALTYLHLYCEDGRKCSPCFQCTTIASLGLLILTCTCSLHSNSDPCLVLYNPVTMQVKPLFVPQLPAEYIFHSGAYFRLAGVIEGTNGEHYKLLFSTVYADFVESFRVYCVYDSKNSSWKFGRGPAQSLPFIFSKASCKGCFYFLYRDIFGSTRKPLFEPRMGRYNSQTDSWSDIEWVPKHEGGEHLPQIVQCCGDVLFVARRRWNLQPTWSPYHTWYLSKLDQTRLALSSSSSSDSKLWVDVHEGSMPYDFCSQLSSSTSPYFDATNWTRQDTRCEGQAERVFFYNIQPCTKHTAEQWTSSSYSSGKRMPEVKNGVVLFFDRITRKWCFVPKYYPFQKADESSVHKLEFFRPSLTQP